MTFFKKLFKRGQGQPGAEAEQSEVACPHVVLVPQWDSAADMGNPDKVARYTCQSCQAPFSLEEGKRLMADEAERVRLSEAEGEEGRQ